MPEGPVTVAVFPARPRETYHSDVDEIGHRCTGRQIDRVADVPGAALCRSRRLCPSRSRLGCLRMFGFVKRIRHGRAGHVWRSRVGDRDDIGLCGICNIMRGVVRFCDLQVGGGSQDIRISCRVVPRNSIGVSGWHTDGCRVDQIPCRGGVNVGYFVMLRSAGMAVAGGFEVAVDGSGVFGIDVRVGGGKYGSVEVGLGGIRVGVLEGTGRVFVGRGVFVKGTGVRVGKEAPGVRNTLIQTGWVRMEGSRGSK
jgi:hypothetical protein